MQMVFNASKKDIIVLQNIGTLTLQLIFLVEMHWYLIRYKMATPRERFVET